MEIIPVNERKEIVLPLAPFFNGTRLLIDETVQKRKYIQTRIAGNSIVLSADKYIGLIPLNSHFAVNVLPKVPVDNLFKLLIKSQESPRLIESLQRLYRGAPDQINIFDALVAALRRELFVLESNGLHREYVYRTGERSDFRGKLLLKETALRQWSRGAYNKGTFGYFEYSRNVAINQAIHYTLWYVLKVYPHISTMKSKEVVRDLYQFLRWFQGVELDKTRSFLPNVKKLLLGNNIPYSRGYLKGLLSICIMLIEDLGIEFDYQESTDISLPPLIINMERVFERFVLHEVRERLRNSQLLKCWNTSTEHQVPLFQPTTTDFDLNVPEKELAEPDFTICKHDYPILVCDTKYKTKRNRDDVYQIVSHASAYGVRDAMLIYPWDKEGETTHIQCLGEVGGIRLFVCKYPLDSSGLDEESDQLVTIIERIIGER